MSVHGALNGWVQPLITTAQTLVPGLGLLDQYYGSKIALRGNLQHISFFFLSLFFALMIWVDKSSAFYTLISINYVYSNVLGDFIQKSYKKEAVLDKRWCNCLVPVYSVSYSLRFIKGRCTWCYTYWSFFVIHTFQIGLLTKGTCCFLNAIFVLWWFFLRFWHSLVRTVAGLAFHT